MSTILGDNIAKIRKNRGESTTEFGELFGVSHTTVSNWEAGAVPRKKHREILEEMTGLTFEELSSRARPDIIVDDFFNILRSALGNNAAPVHDINEVVSFLNKHIEQVSDEQDNLSKGFSKLASFVISSLKNKQPTTAQFRSGINHLMLALEDENTKGVSSGLILIAILYNAILLDANNKLCATPFLIGMGFDVSVDRDTLRELERNKNHGYDIYQQYKNEFQTAYSVFFEYYNYEGKEEILSMLPIIGLVLQPFPINLDELEKRLIYCKQYIDIQVCLGNKMFIEAKPTLHSLGDIYRKYFGLQF